MFKGIAVTLVRRGFKDPSHMRLMFDCAEICQTIANFMLRGSAGKAINPQSAVPQRHSQQA